MSLELCHRSATDLAAAVRADELSPVDLVRAHLDRIEALGDRTNAFVTVLEESAMERAHEAETAVEAGEDPRPSTASRSRSRTSRSTRPAYPTRGG